MLSIAVLVARKEKDHEKWFHCYFCDNWFHDTCSGLPTSFVDQLPEAKLLSFRCTFCLEKRLVTETPIKSIKEALNEIRPNIMKSAVQQLNLGELSKTVWELKAEVKMRKIEKCRNLC